MKSKQIHRKDRGGCFVQILCTRKEEKNENKRKKKIMIAFQRVFTSASVGELFKYKNGWTLNYSDQLLGIIFSDY